MFADLELASDDQRARATALWERLAASGSRLLNHPTRTLRRYDLLRALHAPGRNQFTVYRTSEDLTDVRFPVFLRIEDDHEGRRSGLLDDHAALSQALDGLAAEDRARMLVVEFCDVGDAGGVYRKYAAHVIGDTVIARALLGSTDWQVKEADLLDADLLREEVEYVDSNPHEHELREVFALAHVDYGRVDYSLLDGRMQVWEINTNPTLVMPTYDPKRPRTPVRNRFTARLAPCWTELDRRV